MAGDVVELEPTEPELEEPTPEEPDLEPELEEPMPDEPVFDGPEQEEPLRAEEPEEPELEEPEPVLDQEPPASVVTAAQPHNTAIDSNTSVERQMPSTASSRGGRHWLLLAMVIPAAYLAFTFKDSLIDNKPKDEPSPFVGGELVGQKQIQRFQVEFDEPVEEPQTSIPQLGSGTSKPPIPTQEVVQVRAETPSQNNAYHSTVSSSHTTTANAQHQSDLFALMTQSPLSVGGGQSSNDKNQGNQDPYYGVDPYLQQAGAGQDLASVIQALKPSNTEGQNANRRFQDNVNSKGVIKVTATQMNDLDYLVPQGKFIHAVLQTAIDSQLPGEVLAKTTHDVYGMQGKRVLIPRGSTLYGEHASSVQRGQNRIFVVWPRLRTPEGVNVELGSTGADQLGRAGLKGQVDTHFWDRFGQSSLLSLIGAGVSNVGTEEGNQVNASTAYREAVTQAFQEGSSKALQQNLQIDDTIFKDQGERIIIFVARDLDFAPVMKSEQ